MKKAITFVFMSILCGCSTPHNGILVMAHGGDEAWNRDVESAVAPLREKQPVEIAFGMARTSSIHAAVDRLEEQGVNRIAVVKMFISGESFHETTKYILGLQDAPPAHGHFMEPLKVVETHAKITLNENGVMESRLIEEILIARASALSTDPKQESVLILAHGPGDDGENSRWLAHIRKRVAVLEPRFGFRAVRCETLREDWPEKRVESEKRIREFVRQGNESEGRVLVIPFRIAGFGPYHEVLEGLDYIADEKGFCPHPNMTEWIDQTAQLSLAAK